MYISGICFKIWTSIESQKNNIHMEDRISEKSIYYLISERF